MDRYPKDTVRTALPAAQAESGYVRIVEKSCARCSGGEIDFNGRWAGQMCKGRCQENRRRL